MTKRDELLGSVVVTTDYLAQWGYVISDKWAAALDEMIFAGKFNPHHEPAGSSIGGQFASGEGGETDNYGVYEMIDPNGIEAPHEVRDEKKLNDLTESMAKNGWQGPPILAYYDGDMLQAVTGSHRIAAAETSGIEIPVSIMGFENASEDDLYDFLNAYEDEDILSAMKVLAKKGLITQEQYNIMKRENR